MKLKNLLLISAFALSSTVLMAESTQAQKATTNMNKKMNDMNKKHMELTDAKRQCLDTHLGANYKSQGVSKDKMNAAYEACGIEKSNIGEKTKRAKSQINNKNMRGNSNTMPTNIKE